MIKKIHATKTESTASVISKVLNSPDDEVTLYVPKGAAFGSSRNDLLLLKREARVVGKVVTIESVDDDILELASTSGLKATNTFLGRKQRAVSDIVSVRTDSEPLEIIDKDSESGARSDIMDGVNKVKEKPVDVEVKEKHRFGIKFSQKRKERKKRKDKFNEDEYLMDAPEADVEDEEGDTTGGKIKLKLKLSFVIGGATVALIIFVILATFVFPRATIALEFEKTDWDFVGSLNVGTSITENSFANDVVNLRGMSFSEKKNFSKSYPATGIDNVERKAKGTMIVYNAYSSEPQELVERTRFTTPDGKIYRMDKGITVPGALIVDGKIVPSSIEVPVTADVAGEEYNINPVPRFRIPGFQGSPKYDGFYGESVEPMTGGFIGERKIATEEDKISAREDIVGTLEESAKTQLFLNLPDGTKILDGTYSFKITDETVDEGESDSDSFTITIYGEASVIVFLEDELIGVFENRVEEGDGVDLRVWRYAIDYGELRFNETGDQFSASINVDSEWTRPFDIDKFKKDSSRKNEEELKTLIFSVPGVVSGEVHFWPFWIGRIPKNMEKVVVDVK